MQNDNHRDFLLKFNAMHSVCRMPWADCAAIYEAETGSSVKPETLRMRVKRAVRNAKYVQITEFPEKIVVSESELTLHGCIWCALRKVWRSLKRRLLSFRIRHFGVTALPASPTPPVA